MIMIEKVTLFLIKHFFYIYVVTQVLLLFFNRITVFNQLFWTIGALYGIKCLVNNKLRGIDVFVLAYLFYILLNGLIIDYPHHDFLYYKAIVCQGTSLLFFFAGKNNKVGIKDIADGNRILFLSISIVGLYSFFYIPGWYMALKTEMLKESMDATAVGETMRLSAIWAHPYNLVYALIFYIIVVISRYYETDRTKRKTLIFQYLILFSTLLLSQLRVAIVATLFYILYYIWVNNKNKNIMILYTAGIVFFLLTLFMVVSSVVDSSTLEYIIEHFVGLTEEGSISNRLEYTSGGVELNSLFGCGWGSLAMEAKAFDIFPIIDCEYQKVLAETGIIGFILLIFILLKTAISMLRTPNLHEEKMAFAFLVVACVGASCLGNSTQYSCIFWYVIGNYWYKSTKSIYENKSICNNCSV